MPLLRDQTGIRLLVFSLNILYFGGQKNEPGMRIWLSAFISFFFFCHSLDAQSVYPISTEARQSASRFAELYTLGDGQVESIAKIEARLERHLSNISTLRSTDPAKYIEKLQAAYDGREHSIRRVLSADQLRAFQEDAKWMRTRRAEQRIDIVKSGGSRIDAEEKALGMQWEANPSR